MHMRKPLALLTLTFLALAPSAFAGDKVKKGSFATLDGNGDGVISRAEWTHDRAKFDRLDTNDDGVLSRTELNRGKTKKTQKTRFHGVDTNKDGVITRGEWRGNDQSFRQHDRNGDGVLSGSEVRTGKKKI